MAPTEDMEGMVAMEGTVAMEDMAMESSLARDLLMQYLKHLPLLSLKQLLLLSLKPKQFISTSLTAKWVITSPMYTNPTVMWVEDQPSLFLDFSTALAAELPLE